MPTNTTDPLDEEELEEEVKSDRTEDDFDDVDELPRRREVVEEETDFVDNTQSRKVEEPEVEETTTDDGPLVPPTRLSDDEPVETFRRPVESMPEVVEEEEDRPFARSYPQPATETMDDLADVDDQGSTRTDMQIPSLRSQVPSSGIYSSHNPNFAHGAANTNYNNNYNRGNTNRTTSKKHLLVLVVLGILVIAGTVYTLKSQFGSSAEASPSPSPMSVVAASPEPTATPAPELTRSDYTIRILNGTSTSGLAGKASGTMKEKGYEVERTGNATNSAFTQTQVRVKDGQDNLLQTLIKDLAPDFSAIAGPKLSNSDASDAEIILGTE